MDVVTLGPVAFSNRDLATVYWLVIFSVWVTAKPDIWASLGRVVRTGSIFLLPLSLYTLWVGALIYGAWQLGWWDPTVIKDTVVWFIVSGLTLFFSFVRAGSEDHFFRRTVLATVRVTALLEVYLNLVAFPLWVELLMQPLLLFLLLISIVAARDEQARSVKRFTDVLLAILGLSIVVATTVQLLRNWQSLDTRDTLLSFLLPIWLTMGVLPFIWGLSAWSNYDSAFSQVRFFSPDRRLSWRARFVLFRTFHFRHRQLRRFLGYWARQLAETTTWRDARRVLDDFRTDQQAKEEAARRQVEDLRHYAGVAGIDAEGRQLDRREFAETVDALEWLATCHMGWYRNPPKDRYKVDMLKIFQPGHTRGLPTEHGITMQVRKDGRAWFAWRRTITGRVFAVGANRPPPNQWFYDGPEPPKGFPGDRAWGDRPFEQSPNWSS